MFEINKLYNLLQCYCILLLSMKCFGFGSFKVVGIFNCEKCSPALAASLAVSDFQHAARGSTIPKLIYEQKNESTESTFPGDLQWSMIIVRSPQVCERLAPFISLDSILVCYRRPTPKTIENFNSNLNTFLSQTTPKAFVPCLFSFIQKLHELSSTGGATASTVVVTLVLDPKHSSNQVEKTLLRQLPIEKLQYQTWWFERNNKLPVQLCKDRNEVDVVIAAVDDFAARHLFCEMHARRWFGESVFVILLGPLDKDWMYLKDAKQDPGLPCEVDEFLTAAEGHYLFDFQGWDEESKMMKNVKNGLTRLLHENGKGISQDFNSEAPFVYDSVWAMLQALNRSISILLRHQDQNLSINEIWNMELQKPFIGVTGEFSFAPEKFRKGSNATIVIHRYENQDYIKVGKHFNGNLSFSPSLAEIIHLPNGWNETRLDLKFCTKAWEMTTRMWIGITLLIIFVSFCIFFVSVRVRRIWRK